MKRKLLAILFCLLFATPMSVLAQSSQQVTCSHCSSPNPEILQYAHDKMGLTAEVLDSQAALPYITVLSQFKGIKDFQTNATIVKVVKVEKLDFVYIIAMNKDNPNKVLYSVVDGEQKQVISVVLADVTDQNNIKISQYDSNGTLTSSQKSLAEIDQIAAQQENEMLNYIKSQTSNSFTPNISIPTNWQYWACQFGSWLACSTGCMIFIECPPCMVACNIACRLAFTTQICSQYR